MPDENDFSTSTIPVGRRDQDIDYLVRYHIDDMCASLLGRPRPTFDPPAGYWERSLRTAIRVRGIRFRLSWWRYVASDRIHLAWDALLGRHECE